MSRARRSIANHDDGREKRHEREKVPVRRIDEPIDLDRGESPMDRAHRRKRVHEVAERSKPNDEQPLQGQRREQEAGEERDVGGGKSRMRHDWRQRGNRSAGEKRDRH